MEKVIQTAADYSLKAKLVEVPGQPGLYELKFSQSYATGRYAGIEETKFQVFLSWSQVQELRSLLD